MKSGSELFKDGKANMPSKAEVSEQAIDRVFSSEPRLTDIKANFSHLVQEVERVAYEIYLESESRVYSELLDEFVGDGSNRIINEDKFIVLNQFFTSLSNSRKSRAGDTFELNIKNMLERLNYPFVHQAKLGDDRPDYIMPTQSHYEALPADCIIFTCKRTLKERWKQIVSEGSTGTTFFLATIDEKISGSGLKNMVCSLKSGPLFELVPASDMELRHGQEIYA